MNYKSRFKENNELELKDMLKIWKDIYKKSGTPKGEELHTNDIVDYYGKKLQAKYVLPALDYMADRGVLKYLKQYPKLDYIYSFEMQKRNMV